MAGGRPRKPRNLKVLAGTYRKDRDHGEPDFPETDGAQPPEWLDGTDARDEWDRVVALLEANGVLTEADLTMLAHYCNVHGKVVRYWRVGDTPAIGLIQRLEAMAGKFGLTPSERSKVGGGSKKSDNAFANLGVKSG